MKAFQATKQPVSAKNLKLAVAWWNQFDPKTQTELQKRYKLFTYFDLVSFWAEEEGLK